MRISVLRVVSTLAVLASANSACSAGGPSRGPYTSVRGERRSSATPFDVGQAEWTLSRERLARFKRELPVRPYVERVTVDVALALTGKRYRARGVVAIDPGRAARLVLLGPSGTTALDVWVTRDRYRFAIPTAKVEVRGAGADLSEARGLPIGLLRWWFVAPFEGKLLIARSNERTSAFVLRDGEATVTMQIDDKSVVAVRREGRRVEALEWTGRGVGPQAGAYGRYVDGTFGTRVDVFVEEVLEVEPDPAAFLDPDQHGTTL